MEELYNSITILQGSTTKELYIPVEKNYKFRFITESGVGEFQKPIELETDTDGSQRSYIYYCDPNRSDQKGKCEKNHEYIRYVILKGASMV